MPVHQKLPEFTQTRVLRVSDAIQTSHPPSSAPPALNTSENKLMEPNQTYKHLHRKGNYKENKKTINGMGEYLQIIK